MGLGHDQVTYLDGPENSWADGARWSGLLTASEELGVWLRRTRENPPTVSGGICAAGEWAQAPTSAVIAYNDLVAIGFIQAVNVRTEIPRAVSVIGFGDTTMCDLVTPQLSSIATDRRRLGSIGMKMLLNALDPTGQIPYVGPIIVPAKLVNRDSTGPHIPRQ